MLSLCLRKVVPRLIGSEQSAFLGDRYILDGVLFVNEVVDELKRNKRHGIIFKVDFEKAFDSLNWNYLLEVMKCMGFGSKWQKWIGSCLNSASISSLINGSPTPEFKLSRGVRQGDHLSPFLFIIAAEGLNILTKVAVDKGMYKGVEVCSSRISNMRMTLYFR
ncbi:secreted RxLR effector protein 78-like [Rutidosis leptorrhynchoides]|uniref:secreted RxLR effector protein 78-like n=1 Tax=Rutidosis leptorrhynchoides TaxID=125765 RepID=UPI003A999A54